MTKEAVKLAHALEYLRVLTIAGSDSGGGAGIQADLKTFAALGCYGMTAITALTAQNTLGVRAIHGVPPQMLRDQIDAVLEDIGAHAVKIGMLHAPEIVQTVAEAIDLNVAAPVITASLMERIRSRDDDSFADKLLSAMRYAFGGHVEKPKE